MSKQVRRVLLLICDTAWMNAHLVRGWRMTGAEVNVQYFGTTMGRGWDAAGEAEHRERNRRWRAAASEMSANGGLDVIFIVALDDVLESETLAHFRSLGAKLVLFIVDMLGQWYKTLRIVRFMDLVCYGSRDHLEYFRERGISLYEFGFAAIPPTPEELQAPVMPFDGILYTGSPWPYRQMVLQKIAAQGLPLRIHGHSWDRKGGWPETPGKWRKFAHDLRHYLIPRLREEGWELAVQFAKRLLPAEKSAVRTEVFPAGVILGKYPDDRFVAMVRGAAINLGFTQMLLDVTKEYPRMIRLRDFEVPIAGGFYLAQNCPELANYYEIDREVAVWETANDVIERCRYYLAHPAERTAIAERGQLRALANHTWLSRFRGMAAELKMVLPVDTGAAGG